MALTTTDTWPVRTVPLRYWLGPFALAGVALKVRTPQEPAFVTDDPGLDAIAEAAPWNGVDGFFVRSLRIEEGAPRLALGPRHIRYVAARYRRAFIDLSGTYEAYLGKFSAKTRSTLKRKIRKFAELSGGDIDFRRYRTPNELAAFHRDARAISRRSYQEKLFDAGLPEDRDFLAEMRELAEADRVRAFLLFHDARPVAYLYCPIEDGRLIYAFLGYDPDYARHSPGTVLQMLALEHLFAEGRYRIFDFTEGEGEHKRLFATETVLCGDAYFLARRPALTATVRAHAALCDLDRALGRALDRLALKARLKRLLRR